MGVSVRLSRNTRVYMPFWVAIPLWLIVAAVWAVVLAAMLLWWLLVILPGKAVTAWRDSPRRATREAQRPEAIAARQAEEAERARQRADHDARTHRYAVTECSISALDGGTFTLQAGDLTPVTIRLDAKAALHFLPLRKGDIVQVTLAPDNARIEEFWQLSRASGAKPRSAIGLTAADMEWLGLYMRRADDSGQEAGS